MKKIKVLGIAPFESMSTLMLQAGAKRNDISLTVYKMCIRDRHLTVNVWQKYWNCYSAIPF